jgi:hypothetical protein
MAKYILPFDNIASGATADTYKTMAAVILPDTDNKRVRLTAVTLGPADDSPTDANIGVRIGRTDNTSAGTAGSSVTAGNMPKVDGSKGDSPATGGLNYSAEPTTVTALHYTGINARGSVRIEFHPDDAPVANKNETLALSVAPRAASAVTLSGAIEFEDF